jgi:hypothetical protein
MDLMIINEREGEFYRSMVKIFVLQHRLNEIEEIAASHFPAPEKPYKQDFKVLTLKVNKNPKRSTPKMAYQVYTKTVARRTASERSICITKAARINVNVLATKDLMSADKKNVLLLFDSDNYKLGIQPCESDDHRAFSLSFSKSDQTCGLNVKQFLTYIGYDYTESKSYYTTWNNQDRLLEIKLDPSKFQNKIAS